MVLDTFSKLETLKKTFIPLYGNDGNPRENEIGDYFPRRLAY